MQENLRITHYADNIPIPKVTCKANWNALTTASQTYCWYIDDSATFSNMYGALYTWAAVMKGSAVFVSIMITYYSVKGPAR
jgi:hypothetical protein